VAGSFRFLALSKQLNRQTASRFFQEETTVKEKLTVKIYLDTGILFINQVYFMYS
jgi:hypothetical protein